MKKLAVLTLGVAAGLVAAAPMASATESHHDGPHGGTPAANQTCTFTGGDASATSEIAGDSLENTVAQAPVGGNNLGNLGNCSSFLNDNDPHITVIDMS